MAASTDAVSVAGLADPSEHVKLFEFLEKLKKDPFGWQKCIDTIVKENIKSDEEHFMLLQVIEEYLKKEYAEDSKGQQMVRFWMSHWIKQINEGKIAANFLVNKMAQLFALVFATDFPDRWPQFIQEVFLENTTDPIILFLLRTLIAIDSEVVDREIQRSKQVFFRNSQIKDAMRELCVPELATLWTNILDKSIDMKARELCLDVIACYVDWIDIEHVVNDTMIPLIIGCMNNESTSEAAVRVVCAIMEKGMDLDKKFALVSALSSLLRDNGWLTLTESSDADSAIQCGSLISSIGCVLIDCCNKFEKANDLVGKMDCWNQVHSLLDSASLCLENEDASASQTVVEFLRRYVNLLKAEPILPDERILYLSQLAYVCIDSYQMPDDINLENDGENEAEFLDYRKQLRSLLTAIGTKWPDLIVTQLEQTVIAVCCKWKYSSVVKTEAAITLVYSLADIINSNFLTANDDVSIRAKQLVLMVMSSDVSRCGAFVVVSVFFELVCRYDKLLHDNPGPLPSLVEAFLDSRGLQNPSTRLRTRVVYLFCRFVKANKHSLGGCAGLVLSHLAPLLAPSPGSNCLTAEDQMFLYEATSTLIVYGPLDVQVKEQYMRELAGSLLEKFITGSEHLKGAVPMKTAMEIRGYLANIIGYSARVTKAFSIPCTMQSCKCVPIFMEIMNTYLERVYWEYTEMMDSLRQYLHRMVVCLDEEFIPAIPKILEKFLAAASNIKVLHDFLILVQQIITKFKVRLLESAMDVQSLFDVVWTVQQTEHDLCDETVSRNLCYLNRAYLQTVLCIITNNLLTLLASCGMEFMERFSASIFGSCTCSDPVAQKTALVILAKLFPQATLSFVESVLEKTVLTLLQVPLCNHHDPLDAQCVVVQHETTACLQSLRTVLPEKFDETVRGVLPAEVAEKLIHCLTTLKGKNMEKRVDEVYLHLRN